VSRPWRASGFTKIGSRAFDWGVTVYVQSALQEVGLIEYLPANTNTGQAVGALTEARQFGVQLRWRPQQL